MGVGLFLVFQPEFPGSTIDSDGKTLALALPDLDQLARKLEVTPLSEFGLKGDIPSECKNDFQAYLDADEEDLEFSEEWYNVDNGIITFTALLSYMQQTGNTKPGRLARESGLVTVELEDCLKCLNAAKSHGVRFRFDMW